MDHPLQVGITGGIGSGKSLVCRVFQCLGIQVYDADSRARSLMNSDVILIQQIKEEFSPSAYHADGTLDRAFLAKATFGNAERLSKLNALVHPRVKEDYQQWVSAHSEEPYLIREAALMYEAGVYKTVDKMIVVSAPEDLRIRRIKSRDPQRSEKEILNIIKSQLPDEEKVSRADYVIYNDEKQMIIPQVLSLHQKFTLQFRP